MAKFAYRKSPQYPAFTDYMNGLFSELAPNDEGRNDPRRACFIDDMGMPEALLFMLWQASRRAALEEAVEACGDVFYATQAAAAIRSLATEDAARTGEPT